MSSIRTLVLVHKNPRKEDLTFVVDLYIDALRTERKSNIVYIFAKQELFAFSDLNRFAICLKKKTQNMLQLKSVVH